MYKYGLKDIRTINVIFDKDYSNILLTNNLCGGDPIEGQIKYLYDNNWNINCMENNSICIKNNIVMKKNIRDLEKNKLYSLYSLFIFEIDDGNYSTIKENELNNFINLIEKENNIPLEKLEIYIMVQKFYSLYNVNNKSWDELYNLLLSNNKKHFEYVCYRYTNFIKKYKILNNYNLISHNETVLVEFRILHNIEFLIRNMCIKLPNWKHTIVCGINNYDYINNICKTINVNINIIKMEVLNMTVCNYSNLLTTSTFWSMFTGNHILIHQTDSMIFTNNNIEKWLEYDYVGAPWRRAKRIGNGGFSLRKKTTMIYICEKYKNIKNIPEDLFFSECMLNNKIGKIPDYDEAVNFSMEELYSLNPNGGHCFWLSDNNWVDRIIKNIACNESDIVTIKHNNYIDLKNKFDGIFWINLDRSTDRKEEFEK